MWATLSGGKTGTRTQLTGTPRIWFQLQPCQQHIQLLPGLENGLGKTSSPLAATTSSSTRFGPASRSRTSGRLSSPCSHHRSRRGNLCFCGHYCSTLLNQCQAEAPLFHFVIFKIALIFSLEKPLHFCVKIWRGRTLSSAPTVDWNGLFTIPPVQQVRTM